MALLDKVYVSSAWVSSALRFSNGTGTPVTSVVENNDGELIADEYTITFSAVGGGTATVTVVTSSPNNPYNGRVKTGVAIDGSTLVKNVIPGLSFVFSAGSANGNIATILAGIYLGVFDSAGVDAGVPSAGVRHQVTNSGSGAVSDAKATLVTQAIQVYKTGQVFDYIKTYADGATEKVTGGGSTKTIPYALKVIAVSGSGSSKVGTLQVDGVTLGAASILDLTTGASVSGTGLKCISPGYGYRILTGPLAGLEFALSSLVATNDIANVLIFPTRFIQIAPDVAGSEGTYALTDVVLTQAGQSAGVIQAGQVAYYWVRVLVPLGGNAESNPYPSNVTLEASETVSAGWGD